MKMAAVTIGGEDEQWHSAFACFNHGGIKVCTCGAGGADECDGAIGLFSKTEGEETRRSFIKDGNGFDVGMLGKGDRQGG